jgi:HD-GYP domain-containing protein (c-di-GMP phosphodiesterase class II)
VPATITPPIASIRHRAAWRRHTAGQRAGRASQTHLRHQDLPRRGDEAPGGLDAQRPEIAPGAQGTVSASHYLLPVATATFAVAVCPVAIVWLLRVWGMLGSPVVGMVLGMALSLGASWVGCALWERRSDSEDALFSELLIWGFLHRRRNERLLASARELLGSMSQAQRRVNDGLSPQRQAKLLEQLAAAIDAKDHYTHGHSRRVARHSWMIARRMGLPREQVARIRTAAAVHDVGKIDTPERILRKPGALTDEEYEVVKKHPADGARMAAVLHDPELAAMILHHHERLDGTGYPGRLSGKAIPLGARIIAVADTFDAITSARPYRSAYPHKRAIDILREEAGTQLDPAVVRAFCSHYSGRLPLVLWASLASLPERVVSWLGGSLASVVSAAKVAVVAAVVGGAASGAATFVRPPSSHGARVRSAAHRSPAPTHPGSLAASAHASNGATIGRRQASRGAGGAHPGSHGRGTSQPVSSPVAGGRGFQSAGNSTVTGGGKDTDGAKPGGEVTAGGGAQGAPKGSGGGEGIPKGKVQGEGAPKGTGAGEGSGRTGTPPAGTGTPEGAGTPPAGTGTPEGAGTPPAGTGTPEGAGGQGGGKGTGGGEVKGSPAGG